MRGVSARTGLLCAALLALACIPGTAAAEIPVVELSASPAAVDSAGEGPLRSPPRPPLRRFLRPPSGAGASSLRVLNATAAGTRTNGKLIGFDAHRGAYSCSGTALNTPSRSIVLTAGHCVVQGGSAGRRLSFIPAYDHGERPFGSFAVETAFVMPQWTGFENPDFDLAALRVAPNRLGALTDVVGGRGYAASQSRFAPFQIFGYPAAALRGEELRSCRAKGLGSDPLTFPLAGPPALPSSCDMAAGASGGGWLIDGEYLNGVTSYSYPGRPSRLHSPYFGPAVAGFIRSLP
jgi:V8-like Glu-specific endopeptidase